MKYVRDIPFKEFVDSHHRAFDDDLAKLRRSNEDEDVPLIFTETEEILDQLVCDLSEADESEKFDFVFIDAAKSHYR